MGEWIGWKGGVRPVDRKTIVDVIWADGERYDAIPAGEWVWSIDVDAHLSGGGSGAGVISSYRISEPHGPSSQAPSP
ncbi:hypothetical protein EVB56_049 [Rhizobium phage RHph_Y1_10]|nr:hypothetical protein EVB56_049 [Rhizobium phage RHph_Y1_10]